MNPLVPSVISWDSWTDLLLWGQEELAALGPRESQTNAEYLLEEVAGCKSWRLRLERDSKPKTLEVLKYRAMIEQRKKRIPAAYVTGKAYFREEWLEVSAACLVPRPETELLVEAVIQEAGFGVNQTFDFLDLGTGSGAIAISLLRVFKNASAVMADISPEALNLARSNVERYRLSERAVLVRTDFFSAFETARPTQTWPVIVSNPPYLAEKDWLEVEPELFHEPRLALDGGADGLAAYRVIAQQARPFLKENGHLFLEVGQGQANAVTEMLSRHGFAAPRVIKDLSGIERIVIAGKGSHG